MRRASTCVAALALVLAGCGDNSVVPPTALKAPSSSFDILDGANGGNQHFYFLSPLVTSPTYSGTFDPNVVTNVDICELSADPSTNSDSHCVTTVHSFTYQDISVLVDQEMYKVNWNTTDDSLDPANVYRIIVRAGSDTLGYRDVQPVDGPTSSSGAQLIYNFNNGSTIPIKYRIEKGLLCDPDVPCSSGAITNDGGTISVGTGGVYVQPGSLPDGYDAINVTVTDSTGELGGECIAGLDLPQFGPCIRISTQPELTSDLVNDAVVSVCIDPHTLPLTERQDSLLRVYKWDTSEDTVKVLPNAEEYICNQTVGMRQNGNLLQRALAAVGSFFAPPAYAVHTGLGSLTSSFSRFRWALPAWFSIYEGDGQVAPVSTDVSVAPAVIVRDEHGDPVANARVHWDVTTGGGTVVPDTFVYSDASGIARVDSWTLGPTAGLNTLDAWGFGISDDTLPYGAPQASVTEPVPIDTGHVQFTATGCIQGYGTPTIDGTMEPGEWACANTYPFTANLSGGSGTPATLYWMNDGTNLYLAVSVVRDQSDKVASLRFDFDHNGDGTLAASNDAFGVENGDNFFDQFLTDKCINRSQAGCGEDDTADTPAGTKDGDGAIGYDGTHLVYELWHPLASGDAGHDFTLAAGDSIGTFLTLQIGNGANGNTQIPGFRDWMKIHIKGQ
ncbi:MAG: hypothetical protein P8099_07055 [Gemmatimonadota bacterium]